MLSQKITVSSKIETLKIEHVFFGVWHIGRTHSGSIPVPSFQSPFDFSIELFYCICCNRMYAKRLES